MKENFEERIIRLEENGFFLEENVKMLEKYILAQQDQIQKLEADIKSLQQSVFRLAKQNHDPFNHSSADAFPPHWQLGDWNNR